MGIAIEARNLDVLREAILRASEDEKHSGKGEQLMEYVLDICMNVVQERGLRDEVSIQAVAGPRRQRSQGILT